MTPHRPLAMSPFSTPIGTWQVEEKELHPVWINPATRGPSMPPMIPPGPDNPLGLRGAEAVCTRHPDPRHA
jgi:lipoprotein-anchoring transpeptidase ErfK/SrfK